MAARGLGKGLDSLIPMGQAPAAPKKKAEKDITALKEGEAPVMVKITKIEPNREQPRKNFDEDALLQIPLNSLDCCSPFWYRIVKPTTKSSQVSVDGEPPN